MECDRADQWEAYTGQLNSCCSAGSVGVSRRNHVRPSLSKLALVLSYNIRSYTVVDPKVAPPANSTGVAPPSQATDNIDSATKLKIGLGVALPGFFLLLVFSYWLYQHKRRGKRWNPSFDLQ